MPKQIQDEQGNTIDVFTADELKEKEDALTKAQEELKTTNEALAKLKEKDMNFEKLRTREKTIEQEIENLKKDVEVKVGQAKKEVLEGVMKDHYNETLKSLAGEDAELLKKIELQYSRLADAVATKEGVSKKLRDAWTLATKINDPGALNSAVISSAGVSKPAFKSQTKFTPEEKVIGAKFGLDAKDFEKYGN